MQDLIGEQVPALAALGEEGFQWANVHEDAACGLCYTRWALRFSACIMNRNEACEAT